MRTVRSTDQARNRPRGGRACLLLAVLALLAALAARAAAEPVGDPDDPGDPDEVALEGAVLAEAALERAAPGDAMLAGAAPADAAPDDAEAAAAADALRRELGFDGGTGFADAGELFDPSTWHQRPSRWGRLDLVVEWRRRIDGAAAEPSRRDELWLLAVWSR